MLKLVTLVAIPAFAWSLLAVPYCPAGGGSTAAGELPAHHGGNGHTHHQGDEGTSDEAPGAEHPADHCDASLHCVSAAHAGPDAVRALGTAPSDPAPEGPLALYRSPPPFSDAPPPRPFA